MPRRKVKPKFDKKVIIDAFAEMAREKNIDRDLLQGMVEETLSMLVRKRYGAEVDFEIIVNLDKGDIEIYRLRTIVETKQDIEDPVLEVSIEELKEEEVETSELEVGDSYIEEITLDNIAENFGRRLIALATQTLSQRIRDAEKDIVFSEFADKVGEVIVGEVYQMRKNDILIVHNKVEMRLPREEQISNERYRKNQTIKAIIKEVRRSSSGTPEVILSRSSNDFLAKLFEIEIPEIYDGIIQIKAIAREPGERAKIAVISNDERIDPVGACVGVKGMRIHSIVRELNNENIDVVTYSQDLATLTARALSPAKIRDVAVDYDTKSITVTVPDEYVSLAIGRAGQNVRLASMLIGFNITLVKEGGEDIHISEFESEFGSELYQQITALGVESARGFLETDIDTLLALNGMTPELLAELRIIILDEFEEQESLQISDKLSALFTEEKTDEFIETDQDTTTPTE
jgi:N utilization substance protein A